MKKQALHFRIEFYALITICIRAVAELFVESFLVNLSAGLHTTCSVAL